MKIAYLINQYPKISHSFIRREIIALEALEVEIKRFSLRSLAPELKDISDLNELSKTKFILGGGVFGLIINFLRAFIFQPLNFLKTFLFALKIGYGSDRGIFIHLIYLAEACVLSFWLKQEGIRHIHAHFGTNSTTIAMLTSILGDFTYSFTVHGPEEFDKPSAIALPEKIKRAVFVVAISNYGKSQLYRWCDYQQWSKIHVVHCGLDQKFIEAEITPIASENKLVCVGRLCPEKAQLLLLQAIKRLKDQNISCHLTLVGDGDLRGEIEELAEKLAIKEQITITGWASSDEVKQYILDAKIMVLPSFAEGLPVVIMESFALARPVISTSIAGIPELVVNGESGWLCIPSDMDSLTSAIATALTLSRETLEEMGKKAKQKVMENHDIEIEAKKLKDLLLINMNDKKKQPKPNTEGNSDGSKFSNSRWLEKSDN